MSWRSALALAFWLIGGAAPVAAEPSRFQAVVARGDLDLENEADARLMADRLDEAARRVCGGSPRFYAEYKHARAWAVEAFETCHAAALERAVADLNAPQVTAVLSAHRPSAGHVGRD